MKPWVACSLMLVGCGARFVEPHPPELSSVQHSLEARAQPEPVVFAVLWDVHLSTPEECAAARAQWAAHLGNALRSAGVASWDLGTFLLSPTCTQEPGRRLDVAALEHGWMEAERAFPDARIRPVLVYLNNIDLPLPEGLSQDFIALLTRAQDRGALSPALWGLTAPSLTSFDWRVDWTYVDDPALPKAFSAQVARALPFVSTGPSGARTPLLPADVVREARMLKTCQWDARAEPHGFSPDGAPHAVMEADPPTFSLNLPERRAVSKDLLSDDALLLQVEVCSAHCDRLFELPDGTLRRWTELSRCVLAAEQGAPR